MLVIDASAVVEIQDAGTTRHHGELAESSRLALRDLRLTRYPLTDDMADRVWELRHNVSTYDASYVALAERLGLPLITTDGRLVEAVRALSSVEIESYP